MKRIFILAFILAFANPICGFSQTDHHHKPLNESEALAKFNYTKFISDFSQAVSQKGYDYKNDDCLKNAYIGKQSNLFGDVFSAYTDDKPQSVYNSLYTKHLKEFIDYFDLFERNETLLRSEFARRIESSTTTSLSKSSNPNSTQAACKNMDFETGNLSGWTQSGVGAGTAYVSTPGADAAVPAINKVFAGGFSGCVDVLPSFGNLDWVQMSQTFLVTNANKDFVFHTAVVIDRPGHTPCSDNAKFSVSVKDASNNVIPCSSISLVGANASGAACSVFTGFQTSGFYDYLNWTPIIVPLGAYVGQNVTISFRVTRCNGGGGHGARAYVEASCNPVDLTVSGNLICPGKSVKLIAPNASGYNFNWSGPSGFSSSSYSVNPTLSGAYSVTMSLISNPACKMVMDTILVSVPSPTANFNYTVTPCSPTNSVPVMSTSTPASGDPISSYSWIWGDATANGSGSSTNHTYAATGTKTVELKIQSTAGCRDSITKSFAISPQITANFNVTNACLNTATNFTSSSTPTLGIASHAWNFGDGSAIGSGANPSHTYTNSGTFTISYTVTNTDLCQSTITKTVTIYPNPVIAISANTVCLGSTTIFNNTSSVAAPDNIATWAWDFDNNGTPDNGTQNPTNTFITSGTFNVELKAITNNGCRDSLTIPVKVNALPTATFTSANACVNTNVVLNNTSSVSAPDNISSYNWSFGVGSSPATSTVTNPSPLVYASSGVKTIVLNITANTTCTASITQTITVFSGPVANFSTTSVCQSTATAFTDLSTPTGSISSWQWDFTNNGSIDNATASPTNIYASSGTFTTSLIVTTSNGCKDTIALPVDVWGHAIPNFTVNTVCLNTANVFSNSTNTITNSNIGGTPSWSWNFADASSLSTTQDPSHTYTLSGTYNVTLTATTPKGCVDNVVKQAIVNALPTATFTPVNACLNSNVLLNNASTIPLPDNITTYAWSFGLGANPSTTSSIQNPSILTYNASGVKTITLNITANTTCTASITQTVTVFPGPVANFSTTSVCQSTATSFTDLSTPTGSISAWQWDFTNNGSIDNATASPTNIYASSGTFTTSLIVTSSNGCKDTIALPVDVWGHTIPDFSPNNVCFGTATTFTNNTDITTNSNLGTTPSYSWNFADGTGVQVLAGNPAHTYVLGGNINAIYNVTLTATTSHNCVDNVVKVVNVYAIPTASFTADSVCLGSPSHMLNASNGNGNTVNNFIWDFLSNGTVDATGVSNPSFTFPTIGNNAVTYTVSSMPVAGLTCRNVTNTISVYVFPNPVPNFTFVNKCVNAQPNTFDASSSTVAVGTNTSFTWAFGDGGTSPTNATPTHTYAAAGLYNTTLTVTSSKGCQTSIVKQVEVYQKPIMSITASNACFHSATSFTAVSLAGSGTVNYWGWDFNNVIATMEGFGQTTNYVFPAAGNQTVHLVASTINGCVETFTLPIYVDYLPTPAFTSTKPDGCPIHCVTFTDNTPALTAPGLNNTWQWVFGDGTTITSTSSANQTHCYNNSSSSQIALFDVKLIVTTDKGCKDSLIKASFIKVYPTPVASYTVDPNPGSILTPVEQFTNQSVDFTKWWWCFGDGPISDSTHLNPLHNYTSDNADSYYSYLIVANQYGCKDTANVKVEIQPEFTFYIPNAFTPSNEDNLNDFFTGMGIGIDKYEMWIFDRWGVSIFYTDDIHKGWNGKVQGKDTTVQQDVYIWKVKLRDVLGQKHDYVGHVTLLR